MTWVEFSFRYLACQYTNILILIFIPKARISVWKKHLLCLKRVDLLSTANGSCCPPVVQKGQLLNSNTCMCSKTICSTVNQVYVRLGCFFNLYFKLISTKLEHCQMMFAVNIKYFYLEDILCMYFHKNKYGLSQFFFLCIHQGDKKVVKFLMSFADNSVKDKKEGF